jgi:hypothetical protein
MTHRNLNLMKMIFPGALAVILLLSACASRPPKPPPAPGVEEVHTN